MTRLLIQVHGLQEHTVDRTLTFLEKMILQQLTRVVMWSLISCSTAASQNQKKLLITITMKFIHQQTA